MTATITLLIERCGLSHREAAAFLNVSTDSIRSWSIGRNATPLGVIAELRALYARIERAAAEMVALAAEHPSAEEVALLLAADDADARSLGWPCVGVQAAMLGIVAARLGRPCRVVVRDGGHSGGR